MIVPINLNVKEVLLIETFLAESNKHRRKPMSRSEAVRILIEYGFERYTKEIARYSVTPYDKLTQGQKDWVDAPDPSSQTLESYK